MSASNNRGSTYNRISLGSEKTKNGVNTCEEREGEAPPVVSIWLSRDMRRGGAPQEELWVLRLNPPLKTAHRAHNRGGSTRQPQMKGMQVPHWTATCGLHVRLRDRGVTDFKAVV